MAYKDRNDPLLRYSEHRQNARNRNIPFLLTFEEWATLWLESGKWAQRGNRKGQYCMARFNDCGAYEVGNVAICLIEANRAERNQNYSLAGENNPAYGKDYWATASLEKRERRRLAISKALKGRKQTPEHVRARFASRVFWRNPRKEE